jgi:hypothetical protein
MARDDGGFSCTLSLVAEIRGRPAAGIREPAADAAATAAASEGKRGGDPLLSPSPPPLLLSPSLEPSLVLLTSSPTTAVSQPPDYVLKLDQNSTFSGSKTNAMVEGGVLTACVNTTETWQSHFTSRSWTTPQDQINAGYPYFAMPSQTTGQYIEEIDYGAVLASSKVTLTLTRTAVTGSTTATPTISVKKLPGDSWTVYSGLASVFATDFQYVRAQYDFASSGGNDLLQVTGLNVKLDSKLKNDSGTGTANSGDSGGTVVSFGVAFVDIDSISVTPLATTAVTAVYDFVDVANPTSFKVLLFNSSGTRVSGAFSWSARGV